MRTTYIPTNLKQNKKWLLVDATDKSVGRLASEIAKILMGKHKKYYTPYLETGDVVIVINAEKVKMSGHKTKIYRRHSGQPGGLKTESFRELQTRKPEKIIEKAINGMLPNGPLGRKLYKNLKVYKGQNHQHYAQNPEIINL